MSSLKFTVYCTDTNANKVFWQRNISSAQSAKKGNSFLIFLAIVPLHGPASVKLENFAMRANKNKIGAKYIERMTGSKKKH